MNARQEKARNLRYKKSLVDGYNYEAIIENLYEISAECSDIQWCAADEETLLNALDGDEDEAWSFKMMFSELAAETDKVLDILQETYVSEHFDMFIGAVSKGSNVQMIGFDAFEDDYFKLFGYDVDLAHDENIKKVLKLNKNDIIRTATQVFSVIIAYQNIRMKYDMLKAAFDVLKGENGQLLKAVKEIEEAYEAAAEDISDGRYTDRVKALDNLIMSITDERMWLE